MQRLCTRFLLEKLQWEGFAWGIWLLASGSYQRPCPCLIPSASTECSQGNPCEPPGSQHKGWDLSSGFRGRAHQGTQLQHFFFNLFTFSPLFDGGHSLHWLCKSAPCSSLICWLEPSTSSHPFPYQCQWGSYPSGQHVPGAGSWYSVTFDISGRALAFPVSL